MRGDGHHQSDLAHHRVNESAWHATNTPSGLVWCLVYAMVRLAVHFHLPNYYYYYYYFETGEHLDLTIYNMDRQMAYLVILSATHYTFTNYCYYYLYHLRSRPRRPTHYNYFPYSTHFLFKFSCVHWYRTCHLSLLQYLHSFNNQHRAWTFAVIPGTLTLYATNQ